ncbi:MAG: hypothetical protein Q3M24_07235 [Candidatus Electrothrix aestuarii]|uniref:Outer membrane protein beta-barrel domain-containing protein n=1 Tax=Candidatus Electrothrix aestuarii TaxID=3062594 RepID=A0AAU8LZ36_9BACT|nr:hypothetical protein [Candidatus Electrothrix aestuarii]
MNSYTKKTLTLLCAALFFLTVVPLAFAGDENSTSVNTELLGGFKFGVALGLTMDLGDNDRVESAEVVNGVVRVTKDNNYSPRIMLETHYFFTPDPEKDLYLKNGKFLGHQEGEFGIGPFVAIQNGSDDFIEYIGAGVMLGFRRGNTKESFNIGLGVVVDPSSQILGDGIVENQPLPEGETAVRYKETSQLGLLAMVSYAF